MPKKKTSKRRTNKKTPVDKKCIKMCKSDSEKITGKDKKMFMKMCNSICDSQLFIPENKLRELTKTHLSAIQRNNMKEALDKIPDNKVVIEKLLDNTYDKFKQHYLPILFKFKQDKKLFV